MMRVARTVAAYSLLVLLLGPGSLRAETLRLATGSPYELGLVDALFKAFQGQNPCELNVTKAGSGESLALLKEGKVDLVMVHAPEAEGAAVKEGWACGRTYLGGNDFVIVGPDTDPAHIRTCSTAVCAYRRIAEARSVFFSRGDNSGTHKKELELWKQAGINPGGEWYRITKDFMMASFQKANSEQGHFMTDRSTYLVAKKEIPELTLVVLFEKDPVLINRYHALTINPERYPAAAYELAKKFVAFLMSEKGQEIIATFGTEEYGQPLYFSASAEAGK